MTDSNNKTRRQFLFTFSTLSVAMAAQVSIYAIGSAFKNLDGSLVAGAKNCPPPRPTKYIPPGWRSCGPVSCNTVTGQWTDPGVSLPSGGCEGGY